MNYEDELLMKYSPNPKLEDRIEIRKLLFHEIEHEDDNDNESHEPMRVLCFLLFQIGNVEDCEIIWKAKMLNMDAGCMIDGVLLCGAGYNEILNYLESKNILPKMKNYIEEYIGKDFDKDEIANEFMRYYGIPD